MSLLAEVVPVLAHEIRANDLISLVSTCRALRALQALPLDLSDKCRHAAELLRAARVHGPRFTISHLHVDRCDQQQQLDSLFALPGLASVSVRSGRGVSRLPVSSSLSTLRLLSDVGASLARLESVSSCPALHTLVIHTLESLSAAAGAAALADLAAAPSLRSLELRKLRHVSDLSPLATGTAKWQLTWLGLQGCRSLRDVSPLARLRSLEELDLSSCPAIKSVSALGACKQLRQLRATGCTALVDVTGLAACTALQTLYLTACTSLRDVGELATCRALHTLHLGRCKSVVDVSDLGRCESLRVLNLRCSGATVIPRRDGLHVEFDVPTLVASLFS